MVEGGGHRPAPGADGQMVQEMADEMPDLIVEPIQGKLPGEVSWSPDSL
jgi:hypothetical protein